MFRNHGLHPASESSFDQLNLFLCVSRHGNCSSKVLLQKIIVCFNCPIADVSLLRVAGIYANLFGNHNYDSHCLIKLATFFVNIKREFTIRGHCSPLSEFIEGKANVLVLYLAMLEHHPDWFSSPITVHVIELWSSITLSNLHLLWLLWWVLIFIHVQIWIGWGPCLDRILNLGLGSIVRSATNSHLELLSNLFE